MSIVLPNGMTTINNDLFFGCYSMTSVVIPKSVTVIEEDVFIYCSRLTYIYYAGTEAEWAAIEKEGANIPSHATIRYNYGS